ncbi:MAG TPA: MerR family transcriptional regulator [Bacteroidetes bacterium]|nr:MerR family transcriptional regulator [Bacteroidota bacterium]
MATYSIRDLEKISGIKAHTLRIWEQRYSILKPHRTETNIRYYEEEDLRLLLSISILNSNGYKISRIAKMQGEEIHQTCEQLCSGCEEYANQISSLTFSMIEMDEERFDKVISKGIKRYGLEKMMKNIVHPFLERVGILWQTGTICPAQEHFISNLLRQKIIVAIDEQEKPSGEGVPKYLLFLPDNELHENGLLLATYLLRARGNQVLYLGASLPEVHLQSVIEKYSPDYLLTFITICPDKETAGDYLSRLGNRYPKATILASGQATCSCSDLPDNVQVLGCIRELNEIALDPS